MNEYIYMIALATEDGDLTGGYCYQVFKTEEAAMKYIKDQNRVVYKQKDHGTIYAATDYITGPYAMIIKLPVTKGVIDDIDVIDDQFYVIMGTDEYGTPYGGIFTGAFKTIAGAFEFLKDEKYTPCRRSQSHITFRSNDYRPSYLTIKRLKAKD